jgi:hypothetical protein
MGPHMYLIEILLPVANNDGQPFPDTKRAQVSQELTDTFGGLTAFTRAPAQGVVRYGQEKVRDDIVVLEVMAEKLDREWWGAFRLRLQSVFEQDEILIRATAVTRL